MSSRPIIDWNFQQVYEIYPHWRHRYPEGITENIEHVFSVCVDRTIPIVLAPREHTRYQWLPWPEAAESCFSWSNALAIRALAERFRP
jgi:dATP pyrophosphohydrolase